MDVMAAHKMNVFHWHLTEDQGWRLEIPKFPELVKYGAVRSQSEYPDGLGKNQALDGQKYGPFFYTAEDVKEILAYAAARHIRVIPEIELPGHAQAALAAYPQLCCRGMVEPREPNVKHKKAVAPRLTQACRSVPVPPGRFRRRIRPAGA